MRGPGPPVTMAAVVLAAVALAGPTAVVPVKAADSPTRVATLLPFVAEALDPAPGNAELVAMVRRSTMEAIPDGVTDLGTAHHPNYELLAVARPDVVVGDVRLHGSMRGDLERFAGEVLLIDTGSVDGTLAGLEALGTRVGADVTLTDRVSDTRRALAGLEAVEPASVLLVFGVPGHFMCMTGDTWLGDLVAGLGLRNVVDESIGSSRVPGFVTPSDEVLASLSPDLILVVSHGDPDAMERAFAAERSRNTAWGRLSGDGWHVLDPARFGTNPGLGLADAGREILRIAARTSG